MKTSRTIKVCKIDSLNFASFAIKQGVDFLGIHVLSAEDLYKHHELTELIIKMGGRPIIVTKISNFNTLTQLVTIYKPHGIQLHFELNVKLIKKLKRNFPKLLLFGVITNQSILEKIHEADPFLDFFIYDTSYLGGTGIPNEYGLVSSLSETEKAKTLLAGGVTLERIKKLFNIDINGYDIQSFFREELQISYRKLEQVCDLVKYPRQSKISVSLTDLPLKDIPRISSYYNSANLNYHLDYSDGSLYKDFLTTGKSIEEKHNFIWQYPFSIHLFIGDEQLLIQLIKKYAERFPLNLVSIFIQYKKGLNIYEVLSSVKNIKIVVSVYYKEIEDFFSHYKSYPFISIVLPANDKKNKLNEISQNLNQYEEILSQKEIWLDRGIKLSDIKFLIKNLKFKFNVIIGKEVINKWNNLPKVYEYLSQEK